MVPGGTDETLPILDREEYAAWDRTVGDFSSVLPVAIDVLGGKHGSRPRGTDRAALVARFAERIAEHAEALALLDTRDTGNPLTAMRADVAKGVRSLAAACSG